MNGLSSDEIKRYSRHLLLSDFGRDGQLKLKQAKVLVVGAGGLGCPVLLYLTAAGVGTLGIVDFDAVDISNLQRQVLFTVNDIGLSKAASATKRLTQLNPHVTFKPIEVRLTSENALDILKDYDVVVDGTDNFATRYLLNDACILLDKPIVYGSILKFEGQVSVFNYRKKDGSHSSNYRDLFPTPPDPDSVPNCEEAGVLGVLPGMIGSIQANEVIKIITGIHEPVVDTLLILDAETMDVTKFKIQNRGTRKTVKSLIDYDLFCKSDEKNKSLNRSIETNMKEITVQELKKLQDEGADFQLIDVREPHEFDICNLNGELIPLSEVPHHVDKIDKTRQVVIHCRSGKRSGDSILWLEKNHKFENLYNLKGGILAWAREIDPEMPTY